MTQSETYSVLRVEVCSSMHELERHTRVPVPDSGVQSGVPSAQVVRIQRTLDGRNESVDALEVADGATHVKTSLVVLHRKAKLACVPGRCSKRTPTV